jgi:hypothetical protein
MRRSSGESRLPILSMAPGPRFETFVYADQVLGLNLPRGIGR